VHAATEFSNNKSNDATKNSNPEEKRRRERDLNLWALDEGSSNVCILIELYSNHHIELLHTE